MVGELTSAFLSPFPQLISVLGKNASRPRPGARTNKQSAHANNEQTYRWLLSAPRWKRVTTILRTALRSFASRCTSLMMSSPHVAPRNPFSPLSATTSYFSWVVNKL